MSLRIVRIVGLFLATLAIAVAAGGDSLEFLHLTDTHLIDLRGVHSSVAAQRKMYEPSAARLGTFLQGLSVKPPDFLLITGDLVDGFAFESAAGGAVSGQIEFFRAAIQNGPVPVFLSLGNHDVQRYAAVPAADKLAGDEGAAPQARSAWRSAEPNFRDATYYSFRKKVGNTVYRFLILDNGSDKDKIFAATQVRWLERQIAESGRDRLIVAMHIPLALAPSSSAIESALRRAENLVLVLAGHRHTDAIESVELGDHHVTQVRTAIFALDPFNFRSIRLFEDHIEIGSTGKRSSLERTIPLEQVPAAAGR